MNNNPITYNLIDEKFSVGYRSPSRKFGNFRAELNNDVLRINAKYGKVYVAFSSGVDSQVILRCFKDMDADFEPFFIHVVGRNDYEYSVVKKSEKFYGIPIKILELNLDQYRQEWTDRRKVENSITLLHHPFEWASKQLPENFPMIMSGANEPAIIGNNERGIYIYHNYYESLLLRFKLINNHRTILDFPWSAESLAAYYCDDLLKTWGDVCEYYINDDLVSSKTGKKAPLNKFNYYIKGFLKGKYFGKDILWPAKKTGYENYPDWMIPHYSYPTSTAVSVNYCDLVAHMEQCNGETKIFNEWNF